MPGPGAFRGRPKTITPWPGHGHATTMNITTKYFLQYKTFICYEQAVYVTKIFTSFQWKKYCKNQLYVQKKILKKFLLKRACRRTMNRKCLQILKTAHGNRVKARLSWEIFSRYLQAGNKSRWVGVHSTSWGAVLLSPMCWPVLPNFRWLSP